jgi:glycosyltransferase involved in cell wall biosynthesis
MADGPPLAGASARSAALRHGCAFEPVSRLSHCSRPRLLTIAHSYCVGVNRRLADEIARTGDWKVTAVGPARFRGDFGWHTLQPAPGEQCTTVAVPVHLSRPVHLMWYGPQLSALLREPWDLVHCWEEPYVTSAAQVARNVGPGVPLVFATFQNIDKRYPPPFNWFERYSLGRANAVIAFGQTIADTLAHRAAFRGRSTVIPPGVDTTRFAPDHDARRAVRRTLGWTDEAPVVGFLGRFVPQKGLALLTAALDRIALPWRALLVGGGPLAPELRRWAARYGDRVVIQSDVAHDDVPRWLNAMDILCAPSQATPDWREQFGRMLIEAFACEVAVLGSDSGEIPHVIGDAGLIVADGDAEALRNGIERLLTDQCFRRSLAEKGRQRAVARYAWPVIARQHSAFFQQVVADRVPAPGRAA